MNQQKLSANKLIDDTDMEISTITVGIRQQSKMEWLNKLQDSNRYIQTKH